MPDSVVRSRLFRGATKPLLAAIVAVIALLTTSHAHAQIPVVAARSDELIPKHEPAYFLERLQNADEPIWREGQVGLAMSGERGLDALAKLLETKPEDAELRKRVRGLLTVGMLTTIRWDALKRRPHLATLVLKEVLEGMDIAKELVAAAEIEVKRISSEPPHRRYTIRLYEKADGFDKTRMERFQRLSGCAVPAIQYLCDHEYAVCRGQGLLLAEHLDATVCRPEIERLMNDDAQVPFLRGPMMAPGVGPATLATRAERSEEQFKIMSSLGSAIEKHVMELLKLEKIVTGDVNQDLGSGVVSYTLRDEPRDLPSEVQYKKQLAITWDQWWKAARVMWKAYCETHGPAAVKTDRRRWWNYVSRRAHRYEFDLTVNGDRSTKLRVDEPVGGHCRITEDGELIAEGPIPLETDRLSKHKYPSGGFKIDVTADGCRPWQLWLASHNEQTAVVRFYKEFLD